MIPYRIFQTCENIVGRLDMKPLSDVRVRRAVSMAIDRDQYRKAIFPEGAEPYSGPIPSMSKYAVPLDALGESARWYHYDVAAAKKLLAEAGYPGGFKTRLVTTSGYGPDYLSRTELLKDMLSKIGIDASIVVQEYPVWIAKTYKGDYEGLVHIPSWVLGDESEWLAAYTPGDTRNHVHLNDPKVTDLVRASREAPNEQAHARLVGQFVRLFHSEMYRVFLPNPVLIAVASSHVKGYVPPVRGYSYPTMLPSVWLE